jgi:hypothetical protein
MTWTTGSQVTTGYLCGFDPGGSGSAESWFIRRD